MNIHYLRRQLKKRQSQRHYEVKPIGSALKLRRQELRMTLEEGAEGICSISYLSKLENNQIEPNPEFVELLSKRLKMKDQGVYDREDYTLDLQLITDWMIKQQAFDENILLKYQHREDHQALLIHLIFDSMNHRISFVDHRYETIKQFIPHLMQDELSLLIFCLSSAFYEKHQYKLAHQIILELPSAHQKNFDHYVLSLRLRLLSSYKLHHGAEIIAHYHEYIDLLAKEGYYHLIEEIRREHTEYLAWYQPPQMITQLLKRKTIYQTSHDYAMAISFYRHQYYPEVLELARKQTNRHGWSMILLLTYEKMNLLDPLAELIETMEQEALTPSEKLLCQYMKHKHYSTKDIMLNYLRRDILDAQLGTDDYLVMDYLMMDAQHQFSKSQFYKEASQVMVNFQRRNNQIRVMDFIEEDED